MTPDKSKVKAKEAVCYDCTKSAFVHKDKGEYVRLCKIHAKVDALKALNAELVEACKRELTELYHLGFTENSIRCESLVKAITKANEGGAV